jgi:hypothetical protein
VHPSEEDGPGYSAGVLALEEQRLGLAILESKDLAVTTDVEFALRDNNVSPPGSSSIQL